MTKFADDEATENARKVLAEGHKVTEKSRSDYASRSKGKPTPTQEELNMTALGAHILEHDEDGSDPDPNIRHETNTRHMEAGKPASYQTRQQHSSHSPKSE